MLEAPKPVDEHLRIAELRKMQLLDTAYEDRFDRITRTTQRIFGVQTALISLSDDERQWFKSKQGMDVAEIPRSISFCGHAIQCDAAFVVPDTLEDARFHDHPLVIGNPKIRFYAGISLHGPTGYRLGTLCILDNKPRSFTEPDKLTLRDLGAWAELELQVLTVKKATEIAREKEARLQAIVETAGDAIITFDESSRIESFNPAAIRNFGHSAQTIIGQHVSKLVASEDREKIGLYIRTLVQRNSDSNRPDRVELLGLRSDGTTFEAEVVVSTMLVGNKREFTGIVRDVSKEKKVNKLKNEFVSTVSHELRTPLTSIRGSLGLLIGGAMGELAPGSRQLLDIAYNNCERLIRLINDILDIEKIESGQIHFKPAVHSLVGLVQQAIESTQSFANEFQVNFTLQAPASDVLLEVLVDPDRLIQVVVNFLSNAAKFSPAGSTVEVVVTKHVDIVRVAVKDRGPGIPDEFRDHIFGKFAQADGSNTRHKAGTGLGLHISKAIVEKLGGTIGFRSTLGGGSEFFFELPLSSTLKPVYHTQSSVLICEGNSDIANLIGRMLMKHGFRSDVAFNAQQARSMLMHRDYHAMTLDLQLPDEGGLSLLRWLRSQEKIRDLTVVIVSAQAATDTAVDTEGSAAPLLDWITKPIDEARLLAAISGAFKESGKGKPCILHVEDDADLASVIGALLSPDWEVVHVNDLATAHSQLSQRKFNVILLDMQLPDGTGTALMTALPARNEGTPVVIFSAAEDNQKFSEMVKMVLIKSRTTDQHLLDNLYRVINSCKGQPCADKIL